MRKHCFTRVVEVWLKGQRVTVEVDVVVDTDKLAEHLGGKAIRNRSRKSAIQGGIVTASARLKSPA